MNHSSTIPLQAFTQYQANQQENNIQQIQPTSQQYSNQYQTTSDHHGQPMHSVLSRFTPPINVSSVQNVPHMPSHFQQNVAPPHNLDGTSLNSHHSISAESALNQNHSQQYQPNIVMTTQVQQGAPQPIMVHQSSPNHQIVPNAMPFMNQPVSTTIQSQSNIPVYQQQR